MHISLNALSPNCDCFQIFQSVLCRTCFRIIHTCGDRLTCSIVPVVSKSRYWQHHISKFTYGRLKVRLVDTCKEVLPDWRIVLVAERYSETLVVVLGVDVE